MVPALAQVRPQLVQELVLGNPVVLGPAGPEIDGPDSVCSDPVLANCGHVRRGHAGHPNFRLGGNCCCHHDAVRDHVPAAGAG